MRQNIQLEEITAARKSHKHPLDRWNHLSELDEYHKWLFHEIYKTLGKHGKFGTVLEIGCSKGYLSALLEKNGFNSIGGDISKTALNNREAQNIKRIMLTGEILPFKNNCFDVVFAINRIEHLSKPEKCISEVFRVLKENGLFIVTTPNRTSLFVKISYYVVGYSAPLNPYHFGLMNKQELNTKLRDAGFTRFKTFPFHNGFAGVPFIDRIIRRNVLQIPLWIPIPFSWRLIAFAYKSTKK